MFQNSGQVLIDPRNFRMKQDIEQYTKLNPQNRFNKLIRFLETLKQSREAQEDFRNWKMDLNSDLVTLTGRVLKQINIHFGNDVVRNFLNSFCCKFYFSFSHFLDGFKNSKRLG